jgi:hypothetical protein
MTATDRMLYPVQQDGLYGYIDNLGKVIIPPEFAYGGPFKCGLAIVHQSKEEFVIDLSGNRVFSCRGMKGVFHEGLCCFEDQNGGKFGFVNLDGEIAIPCQFEESSSFRHGLASVMLGGKIGFINKQGGFVIPPIYSFCKYFSVDTDYTAFEDNGRWGCLSVDGAVTCQPIFDVLSNFSGGVAAARKEGCWGFIDGQGNWVIEPKYDDVQASFSEGLAGVGMGDAYGYINRVGQVVIDLQYSDVVEFSEGLATIRVGGDWSAVDYVRGGKCGVIDKKGNVVVEPKYDDIGKFCGGIAQIDVGDLEEGVFKSGYIDRQGNVIWSPSV